MNEKKIIVACVFLTLVILGGGVYFLSKDTVQVGASQNARAQVDAKNYDWGKIAYDNGNVSKSFTIKNTGSDVLKLTNVKTSCTCTEAQISINGTKSPFFGMHSSSPWVGQVSPGKEAKLTVIFDPTFHGPSGVGPMTRLVSLETNDSKNPTLEFTLTGNVVK